MKKKIAALLIGVCVVAGTVVGCGGLDFSLRRVKMWEELKIGIDPAFPPMGFQDKEENIMGFDVEIAAEVCERMGVKPKLVEIDWDRKEQELEDKNIDCIWNGFSKSSAREENMTLSEPYMSNTQVTVVRTESDVKTIKNLAGKTVAVQKGSTAEDVIEGDTELKDSLKKVFFVKDNMKAMGRLQKKEVDAVILDKVVAMYYLGNDKETYRILDERLAEEEYVIGFRKGEHALCKEVEKHLKEMRKDGTLEKISKKWFGEDVTLISQ